MSAASENAAESRNNETTGANAVSNTLASDELILKQISSIRDSINSDKNHYKVDTSPAYQLLPSLFRQLQKNRTPKVISELLDLFGLICSTYYQDIDRLCHLGILDILKEYISQDQTEITVYAVRLLCCIVKQYASPVKQFGRGEQFEKSIHQAVMSPDLMDSLFALITCEDSSIRLVEAVFTCLSQYTTDVVFCSSDCIRILLAANTYLSSTTDRNLIVAICKTISVHFSFSDRVIYLVSSCIIPTVIYHLGNPSLSVISAALHVVGCVVAIDRNDNEKFDYTDYVLDCCLLRYLGRMFQLDNSEIEKETCWIVSNIIAGTVEQIQAVIDSGCIQRIIALVHSSKVDEVRSEAYWVFMNGSTCGSDQQVDFFVRQGVIPILFSMIQSDQQNVDVYDALESIIHVGDRAAEASGGSNPYIDQMDIALLHESCETMQSYVKKRACAFYDEFFRQCKICNSYYYHKDNRVRHCSECNCYVCSNCNCAVFHLDYQLAHWDDDASTKTEKKKRGKKKRKGNKPHIPEKEKIDPVQWERFTKILSVYYENYDMLEVSRLLKAYDSLLLINVLCM